ncbi:MAG: hypothetical protein ACXABV_03880 [Candidatus Thorarchaeota archaeon]|jgi:hypothetical protein
MDRPRLRIKRGNLELVGLALILMLLGSLVIVSSPSPRDYTPREYLHTHSVSFSVSLDDSQWNYPIYGMVTRVGITDMETNGTPVGIAIQDRNNATVFEISNVSQITNISLVAQASDDFKIIVTRESGNASGSLVILIWEVIPIPDFDAEFIRVVPNYFLLSVLAMILIWRIVTMKTTRQSIRPAWVAVLALIGLVSITPYVSGSLGGFFTPIAVTEEVYSDRRTLVLNGTNPNSLVPFGNEVPNSAESFRIHSFEDDNKKYHFELRGANSEVFLSATHENSSIAWEILGEFVSHEHSLSLDREDIDVDVSLSIEASATIVRIPVEALPDSILAVMGFIALILAIATGFSVQTREKVGQN